MIGAVPDWCGCLLQVVAVAAGVLKVEPLGELEMHTELEASLSGGLHLLSFAIRFDISIKLTRYIDRALAQTLVIGILYRVTHKYLNGKMRLF